MELVLGTYSFADVFANLTGPGASIALGAGSGSADEGISIEAVEETTRLTIGADGSGFHTLIQNRAMRVHVRLLKTSPVNSALQQMMDYQRSSSLFWGKNFFSLTNPVLGDAVTASGVAFVKQPNNVWGKEAPMLEWEMLAVKGFQKIGTAVTV